MPKILFKKGHRSVRRKEHKIENNIEKKHCPTCDSWKALNEYNKQSSSWDNLARMCRKCNNEYKRKKRETPQYKNKDREYLKKYKESGRRREVDVLRYKEKKHEIIKYQVAYNKKRYHNDSYFKLKCILRTRVGKVLREQKIKKNFKTMDLLGESPAFVKDYLASKFTEGMSWENHGAWHIDHRRPCCSFDLTNPEEQKKCFHYTNLQPLWAKDNLEKGGRIE